MTAIMFGGSVQGASHTRNNVVRQDSFKIINGTRRDLMKKPVIRGLPKEVQIIAVADGHGGSSYPLSDYGAGTATNVFCEVMADLCSSFEYEEESIVKDLSYEGETRVARRIDTEWKRRVADSYYSRYEKEYSLIKPFNENGEKNLKEVWSKFGTTLLGLLILPHYLFAFQIGDGDIMFVNSETVAPVLNTEKILGVETHSLSGIDAWKKSISRVINHDSIPLRPFMYLVSTDGFANSYVSTKDFEISCRDYFNLIKQYGYGAIQEKLPEWLSETSKEGCGDDITAVFAYFE